MGVALEVRNVTKIYGSGENAVVAVNDVSFSVAEGEFVALVGPSGSGKTTLLAMLAGLLYPTHGSIYIDGQDLTKMNEVQRTAFRRQRIGFTFQANNLMPYLTARENVELMMRLNGGCKSECNRMAVDLLSRLGLGHRLNNLPRQLSGGEQQRVAIARAMVKEPTLILADEPTGNLDTNTGNQILELLNRRCLETRTTLIVATHSPLTCRYVNRILRMVDGTIVETSLDEEMTR